MTDQLTVDLKITPRPGGYARGSECIEQILRAALDVLVEDGLKALTLRSVAARCGMKAGNLAYYFPVKDDLMRELLNAIVSGYEAVFANIAHDPGASPTSRLERLIKLVLNDITTKRTTRVFPELWAMANHDQAVQDRVEELYRRGRAAFIELIGEINPRLPPDERELVALFIAASMEGMTMFVGYEKPWLNDIAAIEALAVKSFVTLVETLQPGEIRQRQLATSRE